jgi:hypothetical protein
MFKVLVYGVAPLVIFVAAFTGSQIVRYTSSNPSYCMSCHVNHPNTTEATWRPSKIHPREVTCVDCHSEEGLIIPEKFAANIEVMNGRCLSCHEVISGGEQMERSLVEVVKISHRLHVDELDTNCIDCHRTIAHDGAEPQTNRPRMDACYACHDQADACTKCHLIDLVPRA